MKENNYTVCYNSYEQLHPKSFHHQFESWEHNIYDTALCFHINVNCLLYNNIKTAGKKFEYTAKNPVLLFPMCLSFVAQIITE